MGSECDLEPGSCEHGIERDYCGWKVCAKVRPGLSILQGAVCTWNANYKQNYGRRVCDDRVLPD